MSLGFVQLSLKFSSISGATTSRIAPALTKKCFAIGNMPTTHDQTTLLLQLKEIGKFPQPTSTS
jgi:hypothetical protein